MKNSSVLSRSSGKSPQLQSRRHDALIRLMSCHHCSKVLQFGNAACERCPNGDNKK